MCGCSAFVLEDLCGVGGEDLLAPFPARKIRFHDGGYSFDIIL
jgi:hypothetical protein